MPTITFTNLLRREKHTIVRLLTDRMACSCPSPYQEFVFNTEEGQRRISVWLDLIFRALDGAPKDFLEDQKRVGYYRAVQGFEFEHVSNLYRALHETIFEVLHNPTAWEELGPKKVADALVTFSRIYAEGYGEVAASYLKTREERIREKVLTLEELQDFTQGVLTSTEHETLLRLSMARIQSSFNVEEVYAAIYRANLIQSVVCYPAHLPAAGVRPLIESSWDRDSSLYWDDQGYESPDIEGTAIKRGLAVPIAAHGRRYGVLLVRNTQKGFKFVEKDSKLLRQFVHILAMALENSFMMEQIERGRYELRMLAGKIIGIKEEERRRLAADIHDTVAQELSGIGYKLEFCIELARRDPEKVSEELQCLTQAVQNSIGQCRKLISELRPDLIDTIGLAPALKRFVRNYHEETGIRVECQFPEKLQLPGHLSICLFRVVQEALANIHKHSRSETAVIAVTQPTGRVHLIVSDQGEGFEMTPHPPWVNNPDKLGLLYMRERVESLGGTLNIRTTTGRGCALEVKIPFGEGNLSGEKDPGSDR